MVRVRAGHSVAATDCVAVEAPLEIRIDGTPFATVMRTPGLDRELAAGFLLAERILRDPEELGAIAHCTDPDASHPGNVVNVLLTGASADAARQALTQRRSVVASSACGVCGRVSVEDLAAGCRRVEPIADLDSAVIAALPDALRATQAAFDRTGGIHAAGLFRTDGTAVAVAEDVGRHNAVDKVVGSLLLREAIPARGLLLCVSGRTSFEILQKAWVAGVPCVVSVSAPSSLAIDLATAAGITLVGFVRGGGFNVYAGEATLPSLAGHQ